MSQITIEPPVATWHALANENVGRQPALPVSRESLTAFRAQVLLQARQFTAGHLNGGAREIDPAALVIAAGHQPVIYHSGVLRKNLALTEAVTSFKMQGLNIIVDTDTGQAGEFSYPVSLGAGEYTIMSASLSEGGEIYLSQQVRSLPDLKSVFDRVRTQILPELIPALNWTEEQYQVHAGNSAVVANAAVRRAVEVTPAYDEILLTDLISLPLAREFYAGVIKEGTAFVEVFNNQLDQFRIDRKIKNHANPFPNLQVSAELSELPFWVIDRATGIRSPLFLRARDQMLMHGNSPLCPIAAAGEWFNWAESGAHIRLAPRALMITALLRLFVSDYFLHGLGGARYDVFLDRLFSAYWNIEAPAFGVVSETRSLFPAQLRILNENTEILTKSREIQFHLGQYLGANIFEPERVHALRIFWESRLLLVEKLKEIKQSGGSAAEVTQELKRVDSEIKGSLQEFFASIKLPAEGTQRAFRFREFPHFFFEKQAQS